MKKTLISIIIVLIITVVIYVLVDKMKGDILLTDKLPSIFKSDDFSTSFVLGGTRVEKDGEGVFPIRHDDKFLYILNGAGNDFKSFHIDKKKKEIIIKRSISGFKQRDKIYYQVIKIPVKDYKGLIINNNVKVKIINQYYAISQYTLLEYDLIKESYKTIESARIRK